MPTSRTANRCGREGLGNMLREAATGNRTGQVRSIFTDRLGPVPGGASMDWSARPLGARRPGEAKRWRTGWAVVPVTEL
ncbi:MAG: hypothetical protein WD848_09810 [Dehalococcoidia bacterium]